MHFNMRAIPIFLFLFLLSCNSSTDCDQVFRDLNKNFESGNYKIVFQLSDSLKKICPENKIIISSSDSLRQVAERIIIDFSVTEEELKAQLMKRLISYSAVDIANWENKSWLEARLINGEKKYFRRTVSNLLLLKQFHEQKEEWIRENSTDTDLVFRMKHTQEVLKNSGNNGIPVVPVNMKIIYTISVNPDVVPEGEKIRCWLPWPKEGGPRQKNVQLLGTSSGAYIIAPDTAIHSSVYMEGTAKKGVPTVFRLAFLYQSSAQHFNREQIEAKPYDKNSDVYKKYTPEQLPQIHFSENIKHLADSIVSGEEDPEEIVKKIYYWFKSNIPWAGALEYSIMPDIPEYVCQNRRGDCGMQTFTFMSMLRYKGIPVRWQSGWMVPPAGKNLHDWCEIYYEGTGWVPADISYNLQLSDNEELKEYFMSGIDSYRLIVNEGIGGRLHPEKMHLRSEPYDFQRGEVEWDGGNLYFDNWDYNMDIEYLK